MNTATVYARCVVSVIAFHLVASCQAGDAPGIVVPPGFRVDHYADDDLAHDIHSMTFDSLGRVVVSGPGYIRTLIDSDADGQADTYQQFADGPESGAQGLYFMGPHLLCAGGDGLAIYRDDNGDGKADGPPKTFLKIAAGGEHHVHSIQQGPDGWWYIIAGNMAGVDKTYATLPTSPLKEPQAGVLMRLKPDLSRGEILSDGFRNAYDFAFNETGDVFTFDSDGERDVSLPWYQPSRVFQVTPRSHAGWISRSWKRSGDLPDMPPVIAEFGRSSPTGVACYRHTQFPSRYDGALFMLDWTFGRVLTVSMYNEDGQWKGTPATFAKGSGNYGFAPTDLEVGPDGSLFISVGGRGTRGSVFRISAEQNGTATASTNENSPLESVLQSPQPESSWSRAKWRPMATSLGKQVFADAAIDETRRPLERVRAIEVLTSVFGGIDKETASTLVVANSVPVRARAAWAVGRSNPESPDADAILSTLNDSDPLVVRFALEALVTVQDERLLKRCIPGIAVHLSSPNSAVHQAAANVVQVLNVTQQAELKQLLQGSSTAGLLRMLLGASARSNQLNLEAFRISVDALGQSDLENITRLAAVRLVQCSLGDVGPQQGVLGAMEGYTARASLVPLSNQLVMARDTLAQAFPSGDSVLDRELIRAIAMLGSTDQRMVSELLGGITLESSPVDDVHRLAALAKIQAPRNVSHSVATAKALVELELKIRSRQLKQDSNWDDRVREIYERLCQLDGAVAALIPEQTGFGQPGHVLFIGKIPGTKIQQAIDGFVQQIILDGDYEWSNDVVFVIGKSTRAEHQDVIRSQVDNLSVQSAVQIVLGRKPSAADRAVYLEGLNSAQPTAVDACLSALLKLPRSNDPAEQHLLLSTATRLNHDEREFKIRESVIRLLQNNMNQSFGFVFGPTGYHKQAAALAEWDSFLARRFPTFQPMISGGQDAVQILARLDAISWQDGNVDTGKQLFAKLSCARCHGGRKALGPDLQGVGKRFSRTDLFASIVDPNRDVSARYQLTSVETKSGKVYSGLVAYESVDGILLRDADQNTIRVEADDIESKAKQRVSLMPAGLLKDASDQQLADLNAYMQSL